MQFTDDQRMYWKKIVEDHFDKALLKAYVPELDNNDRFHSGKVRDNYAIGRNKELYLSIASDRISAFNFKLGTMPFKGQMLNQMTTFFFEQTRDLVPNAFLETFDPMGMVQEKTQPVMLEGIVRAYLAGGAFRDFDQQKFVKSGIDMRDYLTDFKKNEQFSQLLFTPSEKSEHDPDISQEGAIAKGIVTQEEFEFLRDSLFSLFRYGQDYFSARGLILVDDKKEFGRKKDGSIVLIDELFTPDSSRYWLHDDYAAAYAAGREPKQLSKEFLRDIILRNGYDPESQKKLAVTREMLVDTTVQYIELYQLFTGKEFVPDLEDSAVRLNRNLVTNDVIKGKYAVLVTDSYNDYQDVVKAQLKILKVPFQTIAYENGSSRQRDHEQLRQRLDTDLARYNDSITPMSIILLDSNGTTLTESRNPRVRYLRLGSHDIVGKIDSEAFERKLFS